MSRRVRIGQRPEDAVHPLLVGCCSFNDTVVGYRPVDETETTTRRVRRPAVTTMPPTRPEASGKPPVVDLPAWRAARDHLLVREKAHTREGDAIAAARRRLPMVEVDGSVGVAGAEGPVPFVDLFRGRDELVVYHSMWYDSVRFQGQCEGCTFNVWHLKDATVYLDARGVCPRC